MTTDICLLQAADMARLMAQRELSPVEVIDAHLQRIEERNDKTNSYVTLLTDTARREAIVMEQRMRSEPSEVGPLGGVPIAVKDLYETQAGVRATYGALPLATNVAATDATCVERLKTAGAIILGRTNTPEFGYKGITDNMLFGPTSTPFAPGRNAGGSSGGSAAAVAEGMAALATGSDAGGSVRIPAAWCGVYGFCPSFGRLAAQVRPNGFSCHKPFTNVGPLTRSVRDAALMLEVMQGPHPRDPLCLPEDPTNLLAATGNDIDGLRVAYSPNLDVYPVEPEVARVCHEAVLAFETAGATVEPVRLGLERHHSELCGVWRRQHGVLDLGSVLAFARSGIDLLGAHRHELPSQFVESVEQAAIMTAAEMARDDWVRTEVFDIVEDVLATHDLLVSPTLGCLPVENGMAGTTLGPSEVAGVEVDPLIGWCLTYLVNFTGHPAASVPAGFSKDGLPVGLQLIGRRFCDAAVLAASVAFERVRPWCSHYATL